MTGNYSGWDGHIYPMRFVEAPIDELRSAEGFSASISALRNTEWIRDSDIRLTMRLVTPTELATRDAEKAGRGQ